MSSWLIESPVDDSSVSDFITVKAEKRIEINSKKEYDKVQKDLLKKGYKWIDGFDKYYDLFENSKHFHHIAFVVHYNNKTFEWRY